MIVRPRPHSFALLFILRGSILPTIAPRVLLVMALAAAVVIWHRLAPSHLHDLTPAPFTLLGLALSICLGFRNNACHERWSEARRQWGQLIAEARAVMRDGIALLPDDPAMRLRRAPTSRAKPGPIPSPNPERRFRRNCSLIAGATGSAGSRRMRTGQPPS